MVQVHQVEDPGETDKDKENISPEVLECLGEISSKEGEKGPLIYKAIADRWNQILSEGMSREVRT